MTETFQEQQEQEVLAPHTLRATATHRTDGDLVLYGVQLSWTIGANDGADWPPPADWNEGAAPYPHCYEIWLNDGRIRQTALLYWPSWAPGWQLARTHWVCLGPHPYREYRVKVRARLPDGSWSGFTEEVTVPVAARPGDSRPYVAPLRRARAEPPSRRDARHGNAGSPPGRAVRVMRDEDPAEICERARQLNTSRTWQEVVPPAAALRADPPWNGHYLEYRKFFRGGDVASAANPAFAGLDLVGDWPAAALPSSAGQYTFSFAYTAHHVGATWTHQWFVTRDDWDPTTPLTWDDFEPTPFMTEIHGDPGVSRYPTEALPPKTGRHVIVDVWGGHGGPVDDDGHLTGEFFVSCCDVEFTDA
jgi:hypothetical protein